MINNMQPGSVIYDLAAVQGGNTAFSKVDSIIEKNSVKFLITQMISIFEKCSKKKARIQKEVKNKEVLSERAINIMKELKFFRDFKIIDS